MAARIRTLAVAALAGTALIAPTAHANTQQAAADQLVATSVARARATAQATGLNTEILVPGADGSPCFQVSVLGPWGVVYVAFFKPVLQCI